MKQAGVIFSSFLCSNRFHIHFPRVDTRLKMDWVLGAFAAEAASYLYTSISHKKISKKEVKQHIHQCDTWRRRSLAHHTARARKYPPNRNAQQAEVRRRCFVMHTWLVASSKLFMVARNKSSSFLKKIPSVLSFGIGPTGRAVPHGSEKNLPEAEAHIQVRYGKDVLCVNDVGPL